ncbi:YceI family protein [Segeticoccus rhizosphaerae]|jgi:polyisoprenoid-binding protein YceI|uniref:YceI family protein n=1 Tax=Segeticoccus rhizosphaerae TaxID=1104777 RepID=UPI0010C003D7|nr:MULTISPECIES: YceI family protein [Intrasporangiaceae]
MSTLQDLTPGTWTVDAAHSEVGFIARHLMVTKVRGTFEEFSADVVIAEPFEDSSVTATVQLASVDTRSDDRNAHLRSADFFDVENNPEMTFTSTQVSSDKLVGDLTIKGVTQQVVFNLDFNGVTPDPWGGTRAAFEATAEVNRKDFGLTWNVAVDGGNMLVSEKIKLNLDIQLVQQQADAS